MGRASKGVWGGERKSKSNEGSSMSKQRWSGRVGMRDGRERHKRLYYLRERKKGTEGLACNYTGIEIIRTIEKHRWKRGEQKGGKKKTIKNFPVLKRGKTNTTCPNHASRADRTFCETSNPRKKKGTVNNQPVLSPQRDGKRKEIKIKRILKNSTSIESGLEAGQK